MPLTFQINDRRYSAIELEFITAAYNRYIDRARNLDEKYNLNGKIGDNYIDIALDNLEEMLKAKAKSAPKYTTNLGTAVYIRYNEDDGCVYLATQFRHGVPVANHYPIGHCTIVELSPSPNGPWTNGKICTS